MLTFTGKLKSSISAVATFCYSLDSLEKLLKATDSSARTYVLTIQLQFSRFLKSTHALTVTFKHFYASPNIYCYAFYIFSLTDCIKRCLISQRFYKGICLFNVIWTTRIIPSACIAAIAEFGSYFREQIYQKKIRCFQIEVGKMNDIT